MDRYVTRVLREGLSFGESPRWHEGRLWYSDFYRRAVYSMDEGGLDERVELEVAKQPSGLGWLGSGDLVCVSMTDQSVLRVHQGVASLFSDLSPYCGFWANDLVVAPNDVSYVGNFGFDLDVWRRDLRTGNHTAPPPTTNLVVLDPEGSVLQVVADLAFPNGAVLTNDATTLIVAETLASRLSAFDVNLDGTLVRRRVWATLGAAAPDGVCLDDQGQLWVANATANQCLRVREGGEITGVANTSQRAFACALGARDRCTLYVMTAPSSSRFVVAEQRRGRIEAVEVRVPGVAMA